MAKKKTSISLDEEVFKKLTDMSIKGERSISGQLSYLVKNGENPPELQKDEK